MFDKENEKKGESKEVQNKIPGDQENWLTKKKKKKESISSIERWGISLLGLTYGKAFINSSCPSKEGKDERVSDLHNKADCLPKAHQPFDPVKST